MGNSVWLLTALPSWYLDAATHPSSAEALTVVPAIGLVSLLLGMILGAMRPRQELLWFLLLFVSSEALVGIAGAMRGQVRAGTSIRILGVALYAFLGFQLAASAYLIYRIRGTRASAAALAVFSLTYAAAAVFVASMSFADEWV